MGYLKNCSDNNTQKSAEHKGKCEVAAAAKRSGNKMEINFFQQILQKASMLLGAGKRLIRSADLDTLVSRYGVAVYESAMV